MRALQPSNSLHAQRSASQLQVSAIHEGAKGEEVIWEFRHRCAPSCAVLSLIKRSAAPCRRHSCASSSSRSLQPVLPLQRASSSLQVFCTFVFAICYLFLLLFGDESICAF